MQLSESQRTTSILINRLIKAATCGYSLRNRLTTNNEVTWTNEGSTSQTELG